VNAILLNPLPYPNPERIVTLSTSVAGLEAGPIRGQIADADFEDWQAQARSFDAMAYFFARATAVVVGDQAEYARVGRVSGEFFRVFGVHPIAGRWFDPEEIRPRPSAAVAIVTPAFAQRHFGGTVEAIGQTIRLANRSCVIVGVTPADFAFPEGTEIWAPLALPAVVRPPERGGLNFRAVGRLRAGFSLNQAQSEMAAIARGLEQQYPDTNTSRRVIVTRLDEVAIDERVLLFTAIISVIASLLLALAPAFQAASVQLERGLRHGGTRSVGGRRTARAREGLVVVQVGLSVVLLAAGGLLIRSFIALQHVPLGFQPERVLVADATVATPDPRQPATLFFRDLLAGISN